MKSSPMSMTDASPREDAQRSNQPILVVDGLSKVYGRADSRIQALQDVSFEAYPGEFLSIIGPSGCGKSTLLTIAGGILPASDGQVLLEGEPITQPRPNRIGFVFQEYSLLPWRTAQANVELGLEVRGIDKAERKARAQEYLRLVGLSDSASAYPSQLSGGMRQRVAIARSLALGCDILLLDEPFGALDEQTRFAMGKELEAIHRRTQGCVILVTHSIAEAIFLSDRVMVMSSNPGAVREILRVELPRPRLPEHRTLDQFRTLEQKLWDYLES